LITVPVDVHSHASGCRDHPRAMRIINACYFNFELAVGTVTA
jgi:hypothetical protein